MQQTNHQNQRRIQRAQKRKQLIEARRQRAAELTKQRTDRNSNQVQQPQVQRKREAAPPLPQNPRPPVPRRPRPISNRQRPQADTQRRASLIPPPYDQRTETFVCIATGPSLTQEQVDYVKSKPVKMMLINDSYRMNYDADYHYACDTRWWNLHGDDVKKTFKGQSWTQCYKSAEKYDISLISGLHKPGLGRDIIHFGSNSGYQAINLAWLLGAKKIILLGYDMQKTNGEAHWFGEHPPAIKTNTTYTSFVPKFDSLATELAAEKIEVINCTPTTALKVFTKDNLESVI